MKEISEREFKVIYRDFRRISSDLLNVDFRDADKSRRVFLAFIHETPLIKSFIDLHNKTSFDESCFEPQDQEYDLPIDKSQQIAFIYQLLVYHDEKETPYWQMAYEYGYRSGNRQRCVESFNNRVTKKLYDHIIDYLEDIAMDNRFDRKSKTEINITAGDQSPVTVGTEGSNVQSAININNTQAQDMIKMIEDLIGALKNANEINEELRQDAVDLAVVVKDSVENGKQNRGIIKSLNQKLSEISAIASTSSSLSSVINTAITVFNQFV